MVKEIILHLGDTKTGSTTLQAVLQSGAYQLPGQTLHYPGSGATLNQNHLAHVLFREGQMSKSAKRFGKIKSGFDGSDADFAVVSAEHFQSVDPEALQLAIQKYWPEYEGRIRLISYVRPHAEKLLSAFSEQMKFGMLKDGLPGFFEQVSSNEKLDYTPRFEKWRQIFGDRFELRPFVRSQLYKQDVVADFFHFLTGSEGVKLQEVPIENTSMTVGQIALLRVLHATIRPDAKPAQVSRKIRASLSRVVVQEFRDTGLGGDCAKLHLPKDLLGDVIQRYEADAAALDAAFFPGTPMADALHSAEQRLTGPEQSLEAADYFSAETLMSFQMLCGVLNKIAAQHPENFLDMLQAARKGSRTEEEG
ncbi:hypothetical protein [Pseudophaeobacter sp.]|uniref:hypothetical protein n=1 Tax=Pseudophaeobacter sp. TaxID=1971739 RepID=UPI00326718A9